MSQKRTKVILIFRRRLFTALTLKYSAVYLSLFLFLWGVAVLALRAAVSPVMLNAAYYGLFTAALMPVIACLRARTAVPGERTLGAMLDRNNHAGGLLMTSFETELGDWGEQIQNVAVPVIRWDGRRAALLVLLAGAFAAASLLLPVSAVSNSFRHRLNIEDQVHKLTSQLDVLEEENLLTVEETESKKIELEKIQKDAEGEGPVKTFDALDHLADRMNQKAAEAAEQAQKDTETLAKAEALSQEVKEVSKELDEKQAKSLIDGLAKSLEEMLKKNAELSEDLKKELAKDNKQDSEKKNNGKDSANPAEKEKQDAMKKALEKMLEENNLQGINQEQLEQLCEAMKQCQGNAERMCENLQNAGFPLDPEMLKKLAESKEVDKEEAERMLSDLWAECDCEGSGGGEPNSDGEKLSPRYTKKQDWTTDPNAPPEDTRFSKDADEEGAEFKAKFLPPADLEAFRNSQKIGASISAPDVPKEPVVVESAGGVIENTAGTGTANRQVIYPKHRGTVGRYFEKK
ncbi:MAG: hypothetical protein LBN39_07785 [Planctomycetaceae bacterium]|jgi:hypothetical protein|nr:hypothetical protein [Planctomycetaceae bacterium]